MLCHTAAFSAPYISIFFFHSILFLVFHIIHLQLLFSHCHYHPCSTFLDTCLSFCWSMLVYFLSVSAVFHTYCPKIPLLIRSLTPVLPVRFRLSLGETFLVSFSAHLVIFSSSAIIARFLNFFVACLSFASVFIFHVFSSFCAILSCVLPAVPSPSSPPSPITPSAIFCLFTPLVFSL